MSEWISVNINDRYAVNRVGEVKNLETNKKLNPSFNKAGYRVVSLYDKQTHNKCRVLGKKSTNIPTPYKPVQCLDTGEVFESRSEAARKANTQPIHIYECCAGKRKTAGGFRWAELSEPPKEDA